MILSEDEPQFLNRVLVFLPYYLNIPFLKEIFKNVLL